MKLSLPAEFVLFDLEWTSWEGFMQSGWHMPGKCREVIQIGAVKVGDNLQEKETFSIFVKPVKNPQLSEYVMQLTGITQEKIDTEGTVLAEAMSSFARFAEDLPLYSWAGDDQDVLKENCALVGIPYTLADTSVSIQALLTPALAERGVTPAQYTSGTLIEAFGKKGAPAHDAVNDMRNLLEVLKILA